MHTLHTKPYEAPVLAVEFKKKISLSSYFPAGTRYFYGYPVALTSGFLNFASAESQESIAGRPFDCAGPHVRIISFAAACAPTISDEIRNALAMVPARARQVISLPAEINKGMPASKRDAAIKKALVTLAPAGSLLMAQPYTEQDIAGLYQISSELCAWLNDKQHMEEYITAELLPQRLATYDNGTAFGQDKANIPLPCVVKASASSSGDGVYICKSYDDILTAVEALRDIKTTVFVEQYIDAQKNYAVHFGIPEAAGKPIDILGVNEQITLPSGKFVGGIIRQAGVPEELQDIAAYLQREVLPQIRAMGWYGVGGFDILRDESGKFYFIDSNFRMTAMTAFHFRVINDSITTPLLSFTGSFTGTAGLLIEKLGPLTSAHREFLQLITLSKNGDAWQLNGALSFADEPQLRDRIDTLLKAGVRSPALELYKDSLQGTAPGKQMPNWSTVVRFSSSSYRDGEFSFTYAVDNRELTIKLSHSVASTLPQETIAMIGFNLGMCYLMDLAEIVLPRKIWIYQKLPQAALDYWIRLYEEQVIEKCYVLQLPTTIRKAVWRCGPEALKHDSPTPISGPQDHAALCLTGGKESLAVLKTLEGKKPLLLFFLNPETSVHRQKVYDTVKDAHLSVRTISNREDLFGPLKAEFQDLHSGVDMAHLVFNTMLYADKCAYVLIGNEYSSNYPNEIYEGSIVNHQFVKTMHFAENLNAYIHTFVTPDFSYYSPFFGLYEYKIANLLFKDDKYLDVWTSCNQTTPEVNFCSRCHKCAFTYLIARTKKSDAFLGEFFSKNMLEDVAVFKPLMDFAGKKPLDCVGDKSEVWIALEALRDQGVTCSVIDYYNEQIRPQIVNNLPQYKEQINAIQRVPATFPQDIQALIYEAL